MEAGLPKFLDTIEGTYHLVVMLGVMSATMGTILIGTCKSHAFLTGGKS